MEELRVFWLRCCPRCGGDLHKNRDLYDRYVACLQCGHYLTPVEELGLGLISRTEPPQEFKAVPTAEPAGKYLTFVG